MTTMRDALVIGGGPGGATAALLLARAGWSVTLVERKTFPRRKVCGEYLSGTNWPLLRELGVSEIVSEAAGPEVRRVGLFAGGVSLESDLPKPGAMWGRALSRQRLDTMLLDRGRAAGVEVRQPSTATVLERTDDGWRCRVEQDGVNDEVCARVVIGAHGSWDQGALPTQVRRPVARPGDLLGFKAHFRGGDLPDDLMPLLCFPGGYGGMVHCDEGRTSLSLCIRRDQLAEVRRRYPGEAGPAVLEHIRASCVGARDVLARAERDGEWLGAGPIRPGIRLPRGDGLLVVGNAAGEAHPVVAEGISMAMQSAWLLVRHLEAWRKTGGSLIRMEADYARMWRRLFASRLYAATGLAWWAMRPEWVAASLPLLRLWPRLLTLGARLSGKVAVSYQPSAISQAHPG